MKNISLTQFHMVINLFQGLALHPNKTSFYNLIKLQDKTKVKEIIVIFSYALNSLILKIMKLS